MHRPRRRAQRWHRTLEHSVVGGAVAAAGARERYCEQTGDRDEKPKFPKAGVAPHAAMILAALRSGLSACELRPRFLARVDLADRATIPPRWRSSPSAGFRSTCQPTPSERRAPSEGSLPPPSARSADVGKLNLLEPSPNEVSRAFELAIESRPWEPPSRSLITGRSKRPAGYHPGVNHSLIVSPRRRLRARRSRPRSARSRRRAALCREHPEAPPHRAWLEKGRGASDCLRAPLRSPPGHSSSCSVVYGSSCWTRTSDPAVNSLRTEMCGAPEKQVRRANAGNGVRQRSGKPRATRPRGRAGRR